MKEIELIRILTDGSFTSVTRDTRHTNRDGEICLGIDEYDRSLGIDVYLTQEQAKDLHKILSDILTKKGVKL